MSGIYIHIPYCRHKCHYCNFHFSTNRSLQSQMIDALSQEICIRKDSTEATFKTIYFGGGTPSLLKIEELSKIIHTIHKNYQIDENAEMTIEVNPEDITLDRLKHYKSLGINRLSIGVQTFENNILKRFNRKHTQQTAIQAIGMAKEVGFQNISIDIICGIPNTPMEMMINDLEKAISLSPQHISIYCFTLEPKTVFDSWVKKGRYSELSEESMESAYLIASQFLRDNGFEHYEISNYAKKGFQSAHNVAYWQGLHYIGIGPSAHSFDGGRHQKNVAHNAVYLKKVLEGGVYFEEEILTDTQKMNKMILTGLRMAKGLDIDLLERYHSFDREKHLSFFKELVHQGKAIFSAERLQLNTHGFLLADEIALKLIE